MKECEADDGGEKLDKERWLNKGGVQGLATLWGGSETQMIHAVRWSCRTHRKFNGRICE